MRVGLNQEPSHFALKQLRLYIPSLQIIRFDVWDIEGGVEKQRVVEEHGFEFLPILNIPYPHPAFKTPEEINYHAGWMAEFVDRSRPQQVEILNEPRIMGGMAPDSYRWFAEAACRAIRKVDPSCQIILAGEMFKPDRKGPKPVDWWEKASNGISGVLFDGVAIHPYREPGDPRVARIGGNCFGRNGSREAEAKWAHKQARGKALWVTENGWKWNIGEEKQADYLARELNLSSRLGMEVFCWYAGTGEFGLFKDDGSKWIPRPAAVALEDWISGGGK